MIRIVYAGYGATKTYDITEKVTKCYNDGIRTFNVLEADKTFGDPDVGNSKALFIVWDNGTEIVSAAALESYSGVFDKQNTLTNPILTITLPDE